MLGFFLFPEVIILLEQTDHRKGNANVSLNVLKYAGHHFHKEK